MDDLTAIIDEVRTIYQPVFDVFLNRGGDVLLSVLCEQPDLSVYEMGVVHQAALDSGLTVKNDF